ncbi:MAG: porin family protein [Paludibacter sp.]|nr:porin family protein [Paludibacter sp.]
MKAIIKDIRTIPIPVPIPDSYRDGNRDGKSAVYQLFAKFKMYVIFDVYYIRKLFSTSVLILFSATIFSQLKLIEPEIYIGLNAGQTASMVNFSPSVKQSYLPGYQGGLVYRYIADKNIGVQAELNFSQRGWRESNDLYVHRLNYIELPFMTHFFVGRKFRVFFNIGTRISYLFSEKTLTNNTLNSTEEQHIKNVENPFDYGFSAGLGFLLKIKQQVFQLDARGNYSMSDIYSNAKKDYFDTSNNINASVSLAWLIQLKNK